MWNFYSDNSCAREVNSSVSWKWQMSVLLPTYGQVHSCVCFPHRRYFDAANHFISHVMIYFKWMSHQISDYTLVYLQIFLFVWKFRVDFSLKRSETECFKRCFFPTNTKVGTFSLEINCCWRFWHCFQCCGQTEAPLRWSADSNLRDKPKQIKSICKLTEIQLDFLFFSYVNFIVRRIRMGQSCPFLKGRIHHRHVWTIGWKCSIYIRRGNTSLSTAFKRHHIQHLLACYEFSHSWTSNRLPTWEMRC